MSNIGDPHGSTRKITRLKYKRSPSHKVRSAHDQYFLFCSFYYLHRYHTTNMNITVFFAVFPRNFPRLPVVSRRIPREAVGAVWDVPRESTLFHGIPRDTMGNPNRARRRVPCATPTGFYGMPWHVVGSRYMTPCNQQPALLPRELRLKRYTYIACVGFVLVDNLHSSRSNGVGDLAKHTAIRESVVQKKETPVRAHATVVEDLRDPCLIRTARQYIRAPKTL